jgi:hypothetical protein
LTYFLLSISQPPKKSTPVQEAPRTTVSKPTPPVVAVKPTPAPIVAMPEAKPAFEPMRYVSYEVGRNDMLSSISKNHYGTRYYWPLIYAKNETLLRDQDALMPGMVLEIPVAVDVANPETMEAVQRAHIAAYRNYKRMGKKEKARWLLYACYRYVDSGFLDNHAGKIDAADMKAVREYIRRFDS